MAEGVDDVIWPITAQSAKKWNSWKIIRASRERQVEGQVGWTRQRETIQWSEPWLIGFRAGGGGRN